MFEAGIEVPLRMLGKLTPNNYSKLAQVMVDVFGGNTTICLS